MRTWSARGAAGFTLVETLVALALLAVALLGVAGTFGAQSGGIVRGLEVGQAAVSRGYFVTTATFLAQQRLEEVRRLVYRVGPPAVDEIGAGAPPAALPDEDFGTIPGYPGFRRQVSVQDGTPAATMKTVTVTVRYRLPREVGISEETLLISTQIAARP